MLKLITSTAIGSVRLLGVKSALAVALTGQLIVASAQPQSGFWKDSSGQPISETESMKSVDDFPGWLLATTDEDWEKKWNTPPETKPHFNKAEVVPYGKKVFILTFFGNPKLEPSGNANVRCDLTISAPTGKITLVQKDMTCFDGQIKGNPYNLYLSTPVIAFSADPDDPAGVWVVQVVLRDVVRKVALPLRTIFTLR